MLYTVIVTYNGAQWIRKCLESLLNSTLDTKIIVVDNNSTDDTPAIIRQNYPSVILIESSVNLGFGKGNNIGIGYAMKHNPDYVFLLNQDAWIAADTLELLVEAGKIHDDYVIMSPVHLSGSGESLDYNFFYHLNSGSSKACNLQQIQLEHKTNRFFEINFVNAAFWLIKKECLLIVGDFDPVFNHYGEDNDYANRVRFHGYKIGVCPKALGFHDRKQEPCKLNVLNFNERYKKRRVPYLIIAMNINRPYASNIFTAFKLCAVENLKYIKRFEIKNVFTETCSLIAVLFNSATLLKHRAKNKIAEKTAEDLRAKDVSGDFNELQAIKIRVNKPF